MVGVLPSGGLDISGQLLDQTIKPCKVSLESLVLFFRQKDILIFSKGQISICCFYQVVLFQIVLITLVRCAFLRNHTVRFCTVSLCAGAYCDCAILHSMRNFEQNVAGFRKAVAHSFDKVGFFKFCERACHAGDTAVQIFCQIGKRIDHINASLIVHPVVFLGECSTVEQECVEHFCRMT